eukprot:XP_024309066.1 nucleoside diphosphate kinase 6 isoform X2 [Homo sapiens]
MFQELPWAKKITGQGFHRCLCWRASPPPGRHPERARPVLWVPPPCVALRQHPAQHSLPPRAPRPASEGAQAGFRGAVPTSEFRRPERLHPLVPSAANACAWKTRHPPGQLTPHLTPRRNRTRTPSRAAQGAPEGPCEGRRLSSVAPGGRALCRRTSGPIRAYILAHKDAIQLWRTLMGPTRVFRARHVAPDSIRGSFGLTDTRNTTHGSGFQMKTRCGASVSSGGSCKGGAARRKEGRKHRVLHPCLKSFSGVSAALHIHCSILAQATFISYWISSLPTCLFHSHHPPPPSIHLSTHIKKVLFFRRGVVAHACNPGTLGGRGGQGRSPEVGSSRPA